MNVEEYNAGESGSVPPQENINHGDGIGNEDCLTKKTTLYEATFEDQIHCRTVLR